MHRIDSDYEVTLTELICPRSFHLVNDDKLQFTFVTRAGKDRHVLDEISIPSGYYANETEFAEKVGVFVAERLK